MRAQQLAAGVSHRCALLSDGTVRCWGANYARQLGDGTDVSRTVPVPVRVRSGRRKQLAPAELRELVDAFTNAQVFDLKERCEEQWTDQATVRLFYRDGKRERLFEDNHGCRDADPAWRKLEDTVDRITGSIEWVGPRPPRGRLPRLGDTEAFERGPFRP